MDSGEEIGREDVVRLLHAFYAAVRQDDLLGPLFEQEVRDWDAYVDLMAGFWCEALEKGPDHPIPSPPGLLYGLTRESLARWHALFGRATQSALNAEHGGRIRRLSAAISERQSGL